MNKAGRIFEIGYLVVAVFFMYEAYNNWTEQGYGMLALAVMAIFMFFFRRHYLKKFEQRKRDNQQ